MPAVKILHTSLLALARVDGRWLPTTEGVVIDLGLGSTRITPIVKGKVMAKHVKAIFVGAAKYGLISCSSVRSVAW